MTRNYKLKDYEYNPLLNIGIGPQKNVATLDIVSHGNFAIYTNKQYLNIERQHFKEIIDAFPDAEKPSRRTPFWTGNVPRRGMNFEYLIEAYAYDDKHIKLISSSCCGVYKGAVPYYHTQMAIEIKTIQEMWETIKERQGGEIPSII